MAPTLLGNEATQTSGFPSFCPSLGISLGITKKFHDTLSIAHPVFSDSPESDPSVIKILFHYASHRIHQFAALKNLTLSKNS
jgi:hypothetical protein